MSKKEKSRNNMLFACGLIENIARMSNNINTDVVNCLGEKGLTYILKHAEVLHCENIDEVSDRMISEYGIPTSTYSIAGFKDVPSAYTIGEAISRIILYKIKKDHEKRTKSIIKFYNSPIMEVINNYDANMMLSNVPYVYESYKAKKALEY